MIGYLNGKIQFIEGNKIVVNVNGVGYEVHVGMSILKDFRLGENVELHIQTEVREQSFDLYGFLNLEQKEFFHKLLSVPGVGPKTALNLMSFSVSELSEAMKNEDIKKLTSIAGLGKKTAERLILELQHKLPSKSLQDRSHKNLNRDAIHALSNLGYKQKDIEFILENMPSDIQETELIVKYFLQNL